MPQTLNRHKMKICLAASGMKIKYVGPIFFFFLLKVAKTVHFKSRKVSPAYLMLREWIIECKRSKTNKNVTKHKSKKTFTVRKI